MEIYVIQLLLIILFYVYFDRHHIVVGHQRTNNRKSNIKNIAVSVSFFWLILLQGIRSTAVGTDVPGYLDLFHKVQNVNNVLDLAYNRYGNAFAWVTKLIANITGSDQGYLIIMSCAIQIPIALVINKYSKNKLMSIVVYICMGFYMVTFCTLRQSLAYSLCFLSYYGIKERKIVRFLIPVILALMLHISAVVFIPAYWIYQIKTKRATVIAYLIAVFVAMAFRIQIVSQFLVKFDTYFYYYSVEETSAYSWSIVCIALYIVGALCVRYREDAYGTQMDGGLLSIYGFGSILTVCATVAGNARRITDYYILFMIILVPEIFESINYNRNKKMILLLIYTFCFAFYFYLLTKNSGYGIVPYSFMN